MPVRSFTACCQTVTAACGETLPMAEGDGKMTEKIERVKNRRSNRKLARKLNFSLGVVWFQGSPVVTAGADEWR